MTIRIYMASLIAVVLLFTACKKDSSTQQENITKIIVHLTGSNGFDQEFSWDDPDGGDTANASIEEIVIPAGTTNIQGSLRVIDGSKSPAEELTTEIESEGDVHLLVYKIAGTAIIQIDYNDMDAAGKPIGLNTNWTIGTGTGSVNILLFHQPENKDDLLNPGGEIDFDISFPVKIQ